MFFLGRLTRTPLYLSINPPKKRFRPKSNCYRSNKFHGLVSSIQSMSYCKNKRSKKNPTILGQRSLSENVCSQECCPYRNMTAPVHSPTHFTHPPTHPPTSNFRNASNVQVKDLHAETQLEKDRLATELAGCRKALKVRQTTPYPGLRCIQVM